MTDNTSDYYDEVDEEAYALSRENKSVPDPESRDLWQSTTVATDGSGPRVEDVSPVFERFRAETLGNPNLADGESLSDEEQADLDNQAQSASDRAEELRNSAGYVAPTGADAGIFSDPELEGQVPEENFNPDPDAEPADAEAEGDVEDSGEPVASDTSAEDAGSAVGDSETNASEPTGEAPTWDEDKTV